MRNSPTVSTTTDRWVPIAMSSSSSESSTKSIGSTIPIRSTAQSRRKRHEDPRPDRYGDEPRQMYRVPYLLGHLQAGVDLAPGHGIRLVQQRRDQTGHRLSQGLGEPGALAGRLEA